MGLVIVWAITRENFPSLLQLQKQQKKRKTLKSFCLSSGDLWLRKNKFMITWGGRFTKRSLNFSLSLSIRLSFCHFLFLYSDALFLIFPTPSSALENCWMRKRWGILIKFNRDWKPFNYRKAKFLLLSLIEAVTVRVFLIFHFFLTLQKILKIQWCKTKTEKSARTLPRKFDFCQHHAVEASFVVFRCAVGSLTILL